MLDQNFDSTVIFEYFTEYEQYSTMQGKNIININIRNTMKISFLKKITYFRLFANGCTASTFSNYNYKIFDDIKKNILHIFRTVVFV